MVSLPKIIRSYRKFQKLFVNPKKRGSSTPHANRRSGLIGALIADNSDVSSDNDDDKRIRSVRLSTPLTQYKRCQVIFTESDERIDRSDARSDHFILEWIRNG